MITVEDLRKYSFCIRRAMSDTMPLHWVLPLRQIFDHEILFIKQGKIKLTVEGKEYIAEENDLVLLPPRVPHSFQTIGSKPLVQPHLHLDFTYRDDFADVYIPFELITDPEKEKLFRENEFAKWRLPYVIRFSSEHIAQSILELINEIISANIENSMLSALKLKTLAMHLFLDILASVFKNDDFLNRNQSIFHSVRLLLERQLSDSLDLSAIADTLGYSKNHLCTIYKQEHGITIKQQYERMKLQKAAGYLSQSRLRVSEIAETLGFGYVGDFTRFIKRMTGVSPLQYRKTLQVRTDSGAPPERLQN